MGQKIEERILERKTRNCRKNFAKNTFENSYYFFKKITINNLNFTTISYF
jgi:hypothetical protein